ncbi:EF-hand calcium binding domain 2 [Pavlovales sp. CCMP2436]|nr:EF-hand calcium binding domain 2 [Pavlovales sp. CCMP2436]
MGTFEAREMAARRDAIGRDVRAKFALFDKEARGHCDVREVGTIVRALGMCPSELELRDMITEIEEEEPTGFIRFEKFERLAIRVLLANQFQRDPEERLLAAFRAIDTDAKGYVEAEKLRELLTTRGEKFSVEEIDDMLSFAADTETGLVHYEDYITLLEL